MPDLKNSSSIWFSERPTFWAKIKNIVLTLTQFTQSDFSTLLNGNVRIIAISLSPLEKGFFVSRYCDGKAIDIAANFITGIGIGKVDFVQQNKNYFSELINEYNFLKDLNNQLIDVDWKMCKYILVSHFGQIEANLPLKGLMCFVKTIAWNIMKNRLYVIYKK